MSKPTTGQYAVKWYHCSVCRYAKEIGTNHWGECYSMGNYNACPDCPPFKRPTTWVCDEPCPDTHDKPEPWKQVRLGDIADIVEIKPPPQTKQ